MQVRLRWPAAAEAAGHVRSSQGPLPRRPRPPALAAPPCPTLPRLTTPPPLPSRPLTSPALTPSRPLAPPLPPKDVAIGELDDSLSDLRTEVETAQQLKIDLAILAEAFRCARV
jgi:hypothetical protein